MILFKTDREKNEFENIDKRLQTILYALCGFVQYWYNQDITITHLQRKKQEQDSIYKDDEKYKIKPWDSVHQYGRGSDVRTTGFNGQQQKEILEFLNNQFSYAKPGTFTAKIHDVGAGTHLHIQVDTTNITMIHR